MKENLFYALSIKKILSIDLQFLRDIFICEIIFVKLREDVVYLLR